MWIVFLLFPILNKAAKHIAPLSRRCPTIVTLIFLVGLYFFLWLGCNGSNTLMSNSPFENGFFLQATPWVKVWIFAAGMAVGRLIVATAIVKDTRPPNETGWFDQISPRGWGWISDASGLVLGALTFGPPYYARDFTYGSFLPNTAQWGYFHNVEIYLIFPLQLVTMIVFLYALLHNRGVIAATLNFNPIKAFGVVCYPFFLLHYPITAFTLSNGAWAESNVDNWNFLAFDVNNENLGSVLPLGGLALTYIVAHLVNEYFQAGVMQFVQPFVGKLCVPWFVECKGSPCLNRLEPDAVKEYENRKQALQRPLLDTCSTQASRANKLPTISE